MLNSASLGRNRPDRPLSRVAAGAQLSYVSKWYFAKLVRSWLGAFAALTHQSQGTPGKCVTDMSVCLLFAGKPTKSRLQDLDFSFLYRGPGKKGYSDAKRKGPAGRGSGNSNSSSSRRERPPHVPWWARQDTEYYQWVDLEANRDGFAGDDDEFHNVFFNSRSHRGSRQQRAPGGPHGKSQSSSSKKKQQHQSAYARAKQRGPRPFGGRHGGAASAFRDGNVEWSEEESDEDEDGYEYGGGAWQGWNADSFSSGWESSYEASSSGRGASSRADYDYFSRAWWQRFDQDAAKFSNFEYRTGGAGFAASGGFNPGAAPMHSPQTLARLQVLGMSTSAGFDGQTLKAAFHRCALKCHPDMHTEAASKAASEQEFKAVKEAYEALQQELGKGGG